MVSHEILHIALEQDPDGYPPFSAEEVLGIRLSANTFELASAPFYTLGLAVGDTVVTESHGDVVWITSVATPGDHGTISVIPLGDTPQAHVQRLAEQHGASTEVLARVDRAVVIDVTQGVNLVQLVEALNAQERDGLLSYQIGCLPSWFSGDLPVGESRP
jgi:hypothetical protein